MQIPLRYFLLVAFFLSFNATLLLAQPPKDVRVPEVWKSPPAAANGWGWYRCRVKIPESWNDKPLELFVEAVDDARTIRIDGKEVAKLGSFPPAYRSGLGQTGRFKVPADLKLKNEATIEIQTYSPVSRTGFNVAAPALFTKDEAISLGGTWQFVAAETLPKELPQPPLLETAPLAASELEAALKKLPGDAGPLSPQDSLAKLKTPADLQVELVLAEPDIAQPLSIKFDSRGRMWVVEFRQYPEPAGLKMVSRDKFLRTVYDRLPAPPPNHFKGQDRITIHTDTNGDGTFDKHQTFIDGLSLVSSVAIDRGGVWVLNPPYLLFYPDVNQDDIPDGDPEVHLEGFGIEDSHSIANSLRFGPDGWLYAGQGSTVSGDIRRPGEKNVVHSLGQLVWRYHPRLKKYEVFAEGGGNTFGVEIDAAGRIFSGHNGGNTRGFHYVQGGYSAKGFGKHGELSNPFAFGYFPAIPHHDVPRFTHTFIFNEAEQLPSKYRGLMFSIAPLQGQVIMSERTADGSSFKTKDVGYALETADSWFRPVDIQLGPDGGIYVADMYEQRIDHASHYQGRIHRESGRVYRLKGKDLPLAKVADLTQLKPAELIDKLRDSNRTVRQLVQDELRRRGEASAESLAALKELVKQSEGSLAVEALWAIAAQGKFDESFASLLDHPQPEVRRWTIRLACDDGDISADFAKKLAELAYREPDAEVRSQLASSARRLPVAQTLAIVAQLAKRSEDVKDPHLPLLLWWGVETHAAKERDAILKMLAAEPTLWDQPLFREHLAERLMRRYAATGQRADLVTCAKLLEAASADGRAKLLVGFEAAFAGRTAANLPPELVAALAKYGQASPTLRLRQGEPAAVAEALQLIADEKADAAKREQVIQILGGLKQPTCVPVLLELIRKSNNDTLRFAAISALQNYGDESIGIAFVGLIPTWPADLREAGLSVVASRKTWGQMLLTAVNEKKLAAELVPETIARRLSLLGDEAFASQVRKHWPPQPGLDQEQVRQQIEKFLTLLNAGSGNPYQGKQLYATSCGKCHVLFNQGGKIGPDLTAFQRTDVRRILFNVVHPSAEIREGFETYLAITSDGKTLSGFIADQDSQTVVIKTADGRSVTLPREEIETLKVIPTSLMPEGLLKDLNEQQVRDLFAYLRATQPLAE